MGFYWTAYIRHTNSEGPLNLFKRAICHLLTFRWGWFMNVFLRVSACVCVYFFFIVVLPPPHSIHPSSPFSLHPPTFSPTGQTALSLRATLRRRLNLSSPLRAYRDLTQGSYIWLVSTWPTAPHVISVAFHFQPVWEKSIKHLQSLADK